MIILSNIYRKKHSLVSSLHKTYFISKRFYPGGIKGKEFGHAAKVLTKVSLTSTTTTQQITPPASQLRLEPGIRQVLESHPCRTLMVSSQNTALVLFKEKCTALVPYVPSISKSIAITHIPPKIPMPTGQILTDQRAAFALVNANGEQITSEQYLGQVSTEIKPRLFTSTVLGIIPENVCSQVVTLGSDYQDFEINTNQLNNKLPNQEQKVAAKEKEQQLKLIIIERDKKAATIYCSFNQAYLNYNEDIKNNCNYEDACKSVVQFFNMQSMNDGLYLITILRANGTLLLMEQKEICKAVLCVKNYLENLYFEQNIISNTDKFTKKKIDAIIDPAIKTLCQRLADKTDWVNMLELEDQCKLYLNLQNVLENEKICNKDLLTLAFFLDVIRFEKNQPVLYKEFYKYINAHSEVFGIKNIPLDINISNIVQQFVDHDFLVGKLSKNPDTIIELADNTHHMIFTPLYHNNTVEKYVSFIYFTSAANNLKISNAQIFPEEGSKKAQYISIWNVGRIISKELVAETQQTPDAIQALKYTKTNSPIITKHLEDNKDNLNIKKVQEPLIMTVENLQKLLHDKCAKLYEELIQQYSKYQALSPCKKKVFLKAKEENQQTKMTSEKRALFLNSLPDCLKTPMKKIYELDHVLENDEELETQQRRKREFIQLEEKKRVANQQRREKGELTFKERREQILERIKNKKNI